MKQLTLYLEGHNTATVQAIVHSIVNGRKRERTVILTNVFMEVRGPYISAI